MVNPFPFLPEVAAGFQGDRRALFRACGLETALTGRREFRGEERFEAAVGSAEQCARRAVVFAQGNLHRGPFLPKVGQQPAGVRSAPFVDGLERVPRQQDVPAIEQPGEDRVFHFVGVLHLVHGEEAEAFPPAAGGLLVAEQAVNARDQIVEIHAVELRQRLPGAKGQLRALPLDKSRQRVVRSLAVVHAEGKHLAATLREETRHDLPVVRRRVFRVNVVGRAALLDERDKVLQRGQGKAAGIQVAEAFLAVLRVEHGEVREKLRAALRLLPQDRVAKAVDGLHHHAPPFGGQQPLDPVRHLFARLVRERQAEDLLRRGEAKLQYVRDAPCDRIGFSRSGGGQQQHVPVEGIDDFLLLGVQTRHIHTSGSR